MEEGSSVDNEAVATESHGELAGLNIASEIVKQDEDHEKSWSSFNEDSIDERAAKALKLGSVRELFSPLKARSRPQSRIESLVDVIYSSMSSDMRRAACSVSPSPNRTNSRASCDANSAYSTQGSLSTSISHVHLTRNSVNPKTKSSAKDNKGSLRDIQSRDAQTLPQTDDSLLSEPELDMAFRNRKTIDLLSAAGNLQDRRGVHGGYGTPSSYASEQEMNLYFGSTPIPDSEFLGSDCDYTESVETEGKRGWKAVALLDERMKNEIIPDDSYLNGSEPNNRQPTRNKTDQSFKQASGWFSDVLESKAKNKSVNNCSRSFVKASSKPKQKSKKDKFTKRLKGSERKPSESDVRMQSLKKRKSPRKSSSAKNKLHKMLKCASDSLIDKDLSNAMILNLSTPDRSHPPMLDDLAPFDSFQRCLRELKSRDSYEESCEDFISEDFTPRTGSSNCLSKKITDTGSQQDEGAEATKRCETISNGFFEEEFINESIANTYRTPLGCEFEDCFSTGNPEDFDSFSSHESNHQLSDGRSRGSEKTKSIDYDVNLSGFDSFAEANEMNDRKQHQSYCQSNTNCHSSSDCQSNTESESNSDTDPPIYFERDIERNDGLCTARKQLDFDDTIEKRESADVEEVHASESNCQLELMNTTNRDVQSWVNGQMEISDSENYYQLHKQEDDDVEENRPSLSLSNNSEETNAGGVRGNACHGGKDEVEPVVASITETDNPSNEEEVSEVAITDYADELAHMMLADLQSLQIGPGSRPPCSSVADKNCVTLEQRRDSGGGMVEENSSPASDLATVKIKEEINPITKDGNVQEELDGSHGASGDKQTPESERTLASETSFFQAKASVLRSKIESFESNFCKEKESKQKQKQAETFEQSETKKEEDLLRLKEKETKTSHELNGDDGDGDDSQKPGLKLVKKDREPVVQIAPSNSDPHSSQTDVETPLTSKLNSCASTATPSAVAEEGHQQNINQNHLPNHHWSNMNENTESSATIRPRAVSGSNKTSIIPKILITSASVDACLDQSEVIASKSFSSENNNCASHSENQSKNDEIPRFSSFEGDLFFDLQENSVRGGKAVGGNLCDNSLAPQPPYVRSDVMVENCKFESSNTSPLLSIDANNCSGELKKSMTTPEAADPLRKNSSSFSVKDFAKSLKSKYIGLEEQIERILNPSPSPPLSFDPDPNESISGEDYDPWKNKASRENKEMKKVRCDERKGESLQKLPSKLGNFGLGPQLRWHAVDENSGGNRFSKTRKTISKENISLSSVPDQAFPLAVEYSNPKRENTSEEISLKDFDAISETLQFIRKNLNRNDKCVKRLERNIRDSYKRVLSLDDDISYNHERSAQTMSSSKQDCEKEGPVRVHALEEVVALLKKHIQQREAEINGLGLQLRQSNNKIRDLEQKLSDRSVGESRGDHSRDDGITLNRELHLIHKERDIIQNRIDERLAEKESAQIASRKARRDLDFEKEKLKTSLRSNGSNLHPTPTSHHRKRNYRNKENDSDYLDRTRELETVEFEFESLSRENRLLRSQKDQALTELKIDNTVMKEKLDRMNELSAENLLLQSDAADFQAELAELRTEAKCLRSKCYELTEENRLCRAEVRDLRRYIDLLRANKTGDSRQDLLNKIEYYQMEHDRLIDEVRRLKQRLGEVSPRPDCSPRQRSSSPKFNGHSSYTGPSARVSPSTVKFGKSLERGRSPVSDALAASSASSLAASRLAKDRSLSPSAALNIRDLTMDRYNQHVGGPESPESIDSDATELLLKPQVATNGDSFMPSAIAPSPSDDDDDETPRRRASAKCSEPFEFVSGRGRSSSSCRSPTKRSCSPTNPGGFRSVTPKMTSTQNSIPDTARDRYPTKIKKSLPRRAFAPRSPADLKLGYCIKFTRPGGRLSRGTVKYVGHLPTRDEIFIGVELDGHDGKHSGTFQGTKYFTCPTNKGVFTPFSKIIMAWE